MTRKRSFTLLELLVVVAILAIVAGGLLVSYDGLETQSAQGQATFNIAAIDKAVRTFRVLNKAYPDELDGLLEADTTGTDSRTATFTSTTSNPLVSLTPNLRGKLGPFVLNAQALAALNAAGITRLRYVGSSLVDGSGNTGNAAPGSIPNRIFDNTTRGRGIVRTLAVGDQVAVVEALGIADFGGAAPTSSSRLRDIAGLDETVSHVVVAVGLGNNASMINNGSVRAGGLSEAPFYGNVKKDEYSRYILLFHLGSSTDADPANTVYFSEARFLGVLDSKGDWYDEELAEYTGQKS